MTVCDYCGLDKPDKDMATISTNAPEGLDDDGNRSRKLCSYECIIGWFNSETEKMKK